MKKVTTKEFTNKAISVHGNKFDYSKSVANGWNNKVIILCKKHGEFLQNLGDHLQGKQCPECSQEERPDIWKEKELKFLIENYSKYGRNYCSEKLNKTIRATRAKAGELKLTRQQSPRPKHDSISSEQIGNMIRGAKERNLEFDITCDDIYSKYIKQNKKCALSGIDILFNKDRKLTTASVDRIDSSKGYTVSNIQIVHKDFNALKSNFPEKDLFNMCKLIYFNLKNQYE